MQPHIIAFIIAQLPPIAAATLPLTPTALPRPCSPNQTTLEELLTCQPDSVPVKKTAPLLNQAPTTLEANPFIDSLIASLNRSTPSSHNGSLLGPWRTPVAGPIGRIAKNQRFGSARDGIRPKQCGKGHCGIDLARRIGAPVFAANHGKVTAISKRRKSKAGLWIELSHPDNFFTRYLHLNSIKKHLTIGKKIEAGEVIGTVGNTGSASHGAHLHFEIFQTHQQKPRKYHNPISLLRHQK